MIEDRPDLSRIDIKRIIGRDTVLRYVAHTNGGEYAGPCPFCGTGDDRFRVWPEHPDGRGRYWCRVCNRSGDAIDYLRERDRLTYSQAVEELHLYEGDPTPSRHRNHRNRLTPNQKPGASGGESGPRYNRRETVARYTYVDEAGIPLFQVRRVHYYDENGQRLDKQFYQYRREDDQWQRGLKDTRRVIYRLPRVLAAVEAGETVYIVEGEKSVHALEELGLTATCNPMGARKWKPDYGVHLAGAQVVILPDADDDGLEHGNRVAASLIDVAETVKVINLPGLDYAPTHGPDVVDWLADPANTLNTLLTLVEETAPWHQPDPQGRPSDGILAANVIPTHAVDPFDCPALPISLDFGSTESGLEGESGGSWLDTYIGYAGQISPMTPALFHESAGLWAASAVIARRLHLPMAFGDIYPNLCIAWVAPPALFNKTTALNIAQRLIADAAPHLLNPEISSIDALIGTVSGAIPANPNETLQQLFTRPGWTVDDLSGLLTDLSRETNVGWVSTLASLFNCMSTYYFMGSAGLIEIPGAYLSLFGSSSPAALSEHLDNERLWSSGWWPHFALLSPEEDIPVEYSKAINLDRPPALVDRLVQLDDALPERDGPGPPDSIAVTIDHPANDLWEGYNKVMRYDLLVAAAKDDIRLDRRLFSTYGRLPVQALKLAAIFTALDWPGAEDVRIHLAHMQRALRIVERWRASAHRTLRYAASAG